MKTKQDRSVDTLQIYKYGGNWDIRKKVYNLQVFSIHITM